MPAPAMRPSFSASASARLSTTGPRATLMSRAEGFIRASSPAPINPFVRSFSGQWTDTISAQASSSPSGMQGYSSCRSMPDVEV